jgi:hypothetical protein
MVGMIALTEFLLLSKCFKLTSFVFGLCVVTVLFPSFAGAYFIIVVIVITAADLLIIILNNTIFRIINLATVFLCCNY